MNGRSKSRLDNYCIYFSRLWVSWGKLYPGCHCPLEVLCDFIEEVNANNAWAEESLDYRLCIHWWESVKNAIVEMMCKAEVPMSMVRAVS